MIGDQRRSGQEFWHYWTVNVLSVGHIWTAGSGWPILFLLFSFIFTIFKLFFFSIIVFCFNFRSFYEVMSLFELNANIL